MRAISLPFRLDGFGNVASSTDMVKIWADRVRTVMSTHMGERVMRSNFGAGLPSNLFEVAESVPESIKADIATAFSLWLPELTLQEVAIRENFEGNIDIEVFYSIPVLEPSSSRVYSVTL